MLAEAHHYFHPATDVLVPAALEDAITAENAETVRASLVVDGANGSTTPEASEILNVRGVLVVPDILANEGGATVSYFEWAQNVQQFRWELDRVVSELEKTMVRSYADVATVAKERSIGLRTAAFVLGVQRVVGTSESRVALREEIDMK